MQTQHTSVFPLAHFFYVLIQARAVVDRLHRLRGAVSLAHESQTSIQENLPALQFRSHLYDSSQGPGQTFFLFLVTQSCKWKQKVINYFFHILSNFLDALSSPQIWVGCHGRSGVGGQCEGQVLVLDPESHAVTKELQGHSDSIQTLCTAEDRYVLSGSARRDGKIAIWTVE